ncbi:MAG: DUF523 domain-containing protein [Candidatus Omnitrophica bacterium]|nr:DUF523 domain-containing protein [Candidatus Omnitrophota bacterium]
MVSACLAGDRCRYNGKSRTDPRIKILRKKNEAIAVCPEVLGGLSVPRLPCEISGGDGRDVVCGKARVVTSAGEDVTPALLKGAAAALRQAKEHKVRLAILKTKSAACGCGKIYDGSFNDVLRDGNGILTVLLQQAGIRVITDEDFLRMKEFSP